MKLLKVLLTAVVVAGFLGPDVARAAGTFRTGDPCGMIICCCREMCKMSKKGKMSCHKKSAVDCGMQAASPSPTTASEQATDITRLALWMPFAALHNPFHAELLRTPGVHFESIPRALLDRPPVSLA